MAGDRPSESTVTCPICGLRISAVVDDRGVTIEYAIGDWHQRCQSPEFQCPSLCPGFLQLLQPLSSAHASPAVVH